MDINKIIKIADKAYSPDKVLAAQWDFNTSQVRKVPLDGHTDTLAKFIVIELKETYEAGESDSSQLEQAQHVMELATIQLVDVTLALAQAHRKAEQAWLHESPIRKKKVKDKK
jgi:hypothetical protein